WSSSARTTIRSRSSKRSPPERSRSFVNRSRRKPSSMRFARGSRTQKGGPARSHNAVGKGATMDNGEQQFSATPKRDGAASDRSTAVAVIDEVAHHVAMAVANGRAFHEIGQ